MRMKLFAVVVVAFLLIIAAACQHAESEKADSRLAATESAALQTSCDRTCLEGYVDKYMDAMLAHDANKALFDDNCRFTENGVQLPLGNEGLWATMVGKGTYKFYVPDVETQQVAYIGTAREETATPGVGNPVTVALRLKIRNDRITEAEQLVIRPESNLLDPNRKRPPSAAENIEKMGGPHPVYLEVIPPEERPSRDEMIRIANMYFSGLQRNDGKGEYPFSDDCDRYENGNRATNVPLRPGQKRPDPLTETVYSSAWGCKEQFQSGLMHFVSRIRDRRFVAVDRERGIVFTFNFFDHAGGKTRHFKTPDGRDVVAGPTEPWTWQQAELFKIEKGNIRRIEAVLQRCPYGMNSGWSTYEQGLSEEIQNIK
ncbi:MAG: hypothetical protein QUT30_16495 [Acidobacteriota bacterium]|nr:hypothetical protein [Acidobacteriota bacterium]